MLSARSEKLIEQFKQSETPRYLMADSKRYTAKNAVNLKDLQFITRIPNNVKRVGETINKALAAPDDWQTLDEGRVMQSFNVEHYDMKQRWHVETEETSRQRAAKQVDKQVMKEVKAIEKQLFHLQAKRFSLACDATAAAQALAKKWKFHHVKGGEIVEHNEYEAQGRPKKGQEPRIKYQVIAVSMPDEEQISQIKASGGHDIIGGNTNPEKLSAREVVEAYKKQHHVERGFRDR